VNPDCSAKAERLVPFSCKSRGLCPSCGQKRALLWAERMVEEVLPAVPYVQLVFTIPKMLRQHFLWDRSLYGDLCRAAYASTRRFLEAHFPALEDPVPAMIAAPQSWGSLLNFHPHCHALSSLGVFTRDGLFHPVPQDLDFSPLESLFREEVFQCFLKKEAIAPERVELLRSWRHSGFHLNAERRLAAGDRAGLQAVLQYLERPPVALSRLQYLDDSRVLYRGNYHPALGTDHQLLSGVEFLALLVPHVARRFECRIHSYGAISTTIRRALGSAAKEDRAATQPDEIVIAQSDQSQFVRLRRRSWARLIAKVYFENPQVCPSCRREMKVIAALTSPHQDQAIEKILKAMGRWAPPWKRTRRARGPPPAPQPSTTDADGSQLGPEIDQDFNQLVPGADDWPA